MLYDNISQAKGVLKWPAGCTREVRWETLFITSNVCGWKKDACMEALCLWSKKTQTQLSPWRSLAMQKKSSDWKPRLRDHSGEYVDLRTWRRKFDKKEGRRKKRRGEDRSGRSRYDLRLIYRGYVCYGQVNSTPVFIGPINALSRQRYIDVPTTFFASLVIIVRMIYHEKYYLRTAVPFEGQTGQVASNLYPNGTAVLTGLVRVRLDSQSVTHLTYPHV